MASYLENSGDVIFTESDRFEFYRKLLHHAAVTPEYVLKTGIIEIDGQQVNAYPHLKTLLKMSLYELIDKYGYKTGYLINQWINMNGEFSWLYYPQRKNLLGK